MAILGLDWLLLAGCALLAVSIYVETKLKTAEALMNVDAHLAPDWYFGGSLKEVLTVFSILGGIAGASLITYDFYDIMGWWGVALFFGLLYSKYFLSVRRSIRAVVQRLPKAAAK